MHKGYWIVSVIAIVLAIVAMGGALICRYGDGYECPDGCNERLTADGYMCFAASGTFCGPRTMRTCSTFNVWIAAIIACGVFGFWTVIVGKLRAYRHREELSFLPIDSHSSKSDGEATPTAVRVVVVHNVPSSM